MEDRILKIALASLLHQINNNIQLNLAPNRYSSELLSNQSLLEIVEKAAELASGERQKNKLSAPQNHKTNIFESIKLDGQELPSRLFTPAYPLNVSDSSAIFPTDSPSSENIQRLYAAFGKAFDQLNENCAPLPEVPAETYLENVLNLLQRYAWCLPVKNCGSRYDVSLYDQSRMTAALAAILASSSNAGQSTALLVGGDISGIQDFIYTISSKGAASALRGRSFYLQLVCDLLPRYILRRLELPITNLIYSGGGGFYLLVRPSDADKLQQIQADISHILFNQHGAALYLAIAYQPLQEKDFFDGRMGQQWGQLSENLATKKQKRFAEMGSELSVIFQPQGKGGLEQDLCQVCNLEFHGESQPENQDETRKCPACLGYEELGKNLRKAKYFLITSAENLPPIPTLHKSAQPQEWQATLQLLGFELKIFDTAPQLNSTHRSLMLMLDDSTPPAPKPNLVIGRKLLVNVTPINDKGEVANFEDMEGRSNGIQRLGVLRMDADSMGMLFSMGFPEANRTLSRLASLSFAFSLFFEGYIETLAEQEAYKNKVYSIYSGGDDLFFVGAWDAVVELAREIRVALDQYTGGHPAIHLSGGMVLIGGKYPLSQAAQDASQTEAQAKALPGKNAFCFLGKTLPWNQFGLENCTSTGIETAHAFYHRIIDEFPAALQTPLVRRLIMLAERYEEAKEDRERKGANRNRSGQMQILWGPWNWLSFYTLTRMARQNQAFSKSLIDLRDELKNSNFSSIEWIGLAARWAELKLR
ncbi:MAG TPA: type III-A CRISPR-associated protein Cas10/Csm1 [Tenuifilaceae bacterium]|nr:type III-A CRISPR-associated protein Cas10/Csm1 [Tenuifilaceae bacterium]